MAYPLTVRSAPARRRTREAPAVRDFLATRFMQRPPIIMPNYGNRKLTLGVPKTSLTRVLLYDNITQQQMLDVKLAHIKIEKQRQEHLLNMHKRAFSVQVEKRHPHRPKQETKRERPKRLPNICHRNINTAASDFAPLMRRVSTFSLHDVHLPNIGDHRKQVILKLKTQSGCRKVFHTYDESGIFVDVVPHHTLYPDIKDDPRFQNLETSLMTPDAGLDAGFAILSPSYVKTYPIIPDFLAEDKKE
ncbi:uncharacterized protein LOC128229836 [Mya arenaria]|uniref:uncharacterized protein LOC128229836 n=1 Tax=Mya arenaria TaxID=6604 RepID=UPI0022E94B4B|nr:uncharacterized protein LOC128229836 [Mya arenaria]